MKLSSINKQFGLRHPKPITQDVFNPADGLVEYKAINPTAAYRAQEWIYLTKPAKKLKVGSIFKGVQAQDPIVTVNEHGEHGTAQFIEANIGRRKLYVPENISIELLNDGTYKVLKSTVAYDMEKIVTLSQPFGQYPVGYKVFGFKINLKGDNGQGVTYNQNYIETQIDYQNVYLPFNDFIIPGE